MRSTGIISLELVRLQIDAYWYKHGVSPTLDDLVIETGLVKSNVSRYVKMLQENGHLVKTGKKIKGITPIWVRDMVINSKNWERHSTNSAKKEELC